VGRAEVVALALEAVLLPGLMSAGAEGDFPAVTIPGYTAAPQWGELPPIALRWRGGRWISLGKRPVP
jgi:hypothetical protein